MTSAPATSVLDMAQAILQRRAIKSFKPDPIPPEMLHRLLELTVAAPSSWNLQDWRIVLVQDDEKKAALSEAAWGQEQIVQAPVTFVFAAAPYAWKDETQMQKIYQEALDRGAWPEQFVERLKSTIPEFQENLGDRNREYAIKDAMIAATHTALAAEAMGLSSCFMNGWAEDKVKAVIGAGDELAIALLLPVGYKVEPRKNPGRLPLSNNVFVNQIDNAYLG
ncbi:MAG: nitroreductase [Leptolyngbyaceae cyanobacterium SL_1_1]|nr:nitroreductase [Leptolyngbyaceae cyanobacterium RM2_2_21]NJN02161.1 nitroreductase [Leptolyngbyaceae cyanobacterium RM1_1_2]NJO08957.1 nitroreductase [Leptolyngbyaceae cyanobacterium SL_1_1]